MIYIEIFKKGERAKWRLQRDFGDSEITHKSSDGQEEGLWSPDCKTEAEAFILFTSLSVSLRMMDQRFLFLYIMDTASKIRI